MVSADDDRILYDDPGVDIEVVGRRPFAVGLAVVALIAGVVYIIWTAPGSGSNEYSPARETPERIAAPRTGFDASSSDLKACEGTRQAHPDFSIVVASPAAGEGQQIMSRVVQFVVVDTDTNQRYGRDVEPQSLCTLR